MYHATLLQKESDDKAPNKTFSSMAFSSLSNCEYMLGMEAGHLANEANLNCFSVIFTLNSEAKLDYCSIQVIMLLKHG